MRALNHSLPALTKVTRVWNFSDTLVSCSRIKSTQIDQAISDGFLLKGPRTLADFGELNERNRQLGKSMTFRSIRRISPGTNDIRFTPFTCQESSSVNSSRATSLNRFSIWEFRQVGWLAILCCSAVLFLSGCGSTVSFNSPATLSALACTSASMAGGSSNSCTVNLNATAGIGGVSVSLSSSNAAVTLPATVTVPANATSVAFSATSASVTTAQTVTLTATSGTVSKTFALELSPFTPHLSLSTGNMAFGNVAVNTASTPQLVPLTSSG